MNQHKIKKAVFPVAGLGTRFLPATKATPKEMLPIVDKPIIQYGVEEAIRAGVDEIIFVTSSSKRAIEDHFDKSFELETTLAQRGKTALLEMVRGIVPPHVSVVYVRQPEALGLGHAVLCAKPLVGNEPFAVILADDLVDSPEKSCLAQMVEAYRYHQGSVIAVEEVPESETDKYGIVSTTRVDSKISRIDAIVEKPKPDVAPSNLAVIGRYILVPRIFELLEKTERGSGGEIQLTDAISALLQEQQVLAYAFDGRRYDCGSKLGYLQATVDLALKHPELGDVFKQHLQSLACCK